jgi:hypothetical protein
MIRRQSLKLLVMFAVLVCYEWLFGTWKEMAAVVTGTVLLIPYALVCTRLAHWAVNKGPVGQWLISVIIGVAGAGLFVGSFWIWGVL